MYKLQFLVQAHVKPDFNIKFTDLQLIAKGVNTMSIEVSLKINSGDDWNAQDSEMRLGPQTTFMLYNISRPSFRQGAEKMN